MGQNTLPFFSSTLQTGNPFDQTQSLWNTSTTPVMPGIVPPATQAGGDPWSFLSAWMNRPRTPMPQPQTIGDAATAALRIKAGNNYGMDGRLVDQSAETPEQHQARWDARVLASSPVARAAKEATYFGIPQEQTSTGRYLANLQKLYPAKA